MIYSVTGKLLEVEPTYVVIQAGGIGYKCTASTGTLAALPRLGESFSRLYFRSITGRSPRINKMHLLLSSNRTSSGVIRSRPDCWWLICHFFCPNQMHLPDKGSEI